MKDKKLILKVLVGSKAHLLDNKNSDTDYRGVYIQPTSDILSIGHKYKGNNWLEGDIDNTSYEVGHLLMLALKSNPSILEVFKAPIVEITEEGEVLRDMFKYVWNMNNVFNAYTGYGFNQRKKFLDNKENRANKFCVAWLRVLYNLNELLDDNTFTVDIGNLPIGRELRRWKEGNFKRGSVIELTDFWYNRAKNNIENYPKQCENRYYNPDKVNKFLLKIRKNNWN